MELKLQNKDIIPFLSLLNNIKVKSMKANRGRAKIIKKLQEKLEDYNNDETDILKEYVEVDSDGNMIRDENGGLKAKDISKNKEVNELLKELMNEQISIIGGEYSNRYSDFLDYLSNYDEELTSEEILIIDNILEQYENEKGDK